MVRLRTLALLVLLATLCGCGDSKPTIPEGTDLGAYAGKARDEAIAACEADDAKAARAAADRAAAARDLAEKRLKAAPEDDAEAARELAKAVGSASREADKYADLVEERQRLAKARVSWKARSYGKVRQPTLKLVFGTLAVAAEQAGSRGYESLSDEQKAAANLAETFSALPRGDDDQVDWKGVGDKVRSLSESEAAETRVLLAIGYLTLGQSGLALIEADGIRAEDARDANERTTMRILRGIAYHKAGYPRLATQEFETATAELGEGDSAELQGTIHLLLAALHGERKDWAEADREIMTATRVWPNNPIGVLLTGEVMVAQGQYEPAAVSLEKFLADHGKRHDEWFVQRVQTRAREIRDADGEVEPLIYSRDFAWDLARHSIAEAARTSGAAQKLRGYLDAGKEFGARCVDQLKGVPGLGGDEADMPQDEQ